MAGVKGRSGGRRPGSGRKKGSKNKIPADIKAMIVGALESKGGQKYLEEQAEKQPVAFMGLIGKVLPTTLAGDGENPPLPSEIILKIVKPKRKNS